MSDTEVEHALLAVEIAVHSFGVPQVCCALKRRCFPVLHCVPYAFDAATS